MSELARKGPTPQQRGPNRRHFWLAQNVSEVQHRLDEIRQAAPGRDNLVPPLRQPLEDRCSLGTVCAAMRDVFAECQATF
jgi:methylmalonyl-CoA mutase N-terminal domain/subunit